MDFVSRGGHEQAGRRPAVVWQNEAASTKLPTVLVIPLTTQQSALRFPGTVYVEPTDENGLSRDSVALVFQLTAVDQRLLGATVGNVGEELIASLRGALEDISVGVDNGGPLN